MRAAFTGNSSTYWWLLLSLPLLFLAMRDTGRKKRVGQGRAARNANRKNTSSTIISKISNYANQGRTGDTDQE